uniref:Uncharacterized protein n=2 Tax=Physcomitrium patens TaxID=3218 RepID=A0A2K1ITE3_PHYPA|nr:hypothetical protein PHYPA_024489 [Physcomitrium patens]
MSGPANSGGRVQWILDRSNKVTSKTNSRIFPKQLFHSFSSPQQRLRFGWAKSRRQPQKNGSPTSHNPTHLSFARLGPSSPSDVPLRYTTTSCHPVWSVADSRWPR